MDVQGLRGRVVPGATLRGAVLGTGLLLVLTVLAGRSTGPPDAVPALVVLAAAAALPGGPFPALFLLLVAATQVLAGSADDTLWRLPLAAALLHAVHVICALAAAVPARTRVEVAALAGPARRWLLTQVLCLPVLVGVGALARSGASVDPGPWLAGAGLLVAALALLPLALLRR